MPRYFFNVIDRSAQPDADGFEFPDIYAAQDAAVRLCGEIIKEMDGKFWEQPIWWLQVISSDHRLLFTFTFSAEEHDSDRRG